MSDSEEGMRAMRSNQSAHSQRCGRGPVTTRNTDAFNQSVCRECVYVCACVCLSVCVFVFVWERERERERDDGEEDGG